MKDFYSAADGVLKEQNRNTAVYYWHWRVFWTRPIIDAKEK